MRFFVGVTDYELFQLHASKSKVEEVRERTHPLFDKGYLTVDPDEKKIVVSRRLKDEFDNGRKYYPLHRRRIMLPSNSRAMPSREHLDYHARQIFR